MIRKLLLKIFVVSTIIGHPTVLAQDMSKEAKKERMLADLDFVKNIFQNNYAPAGWKKAYSGWDVDFAIGEVKQKILDTDPLSIKQFQEILKNFFISAKDYHVAILYHSTESATLPFRIKGANGRYFFHRSTILFYLVKHHFLLPLGMSYCLSKAFP